MNRILPPEHFRSVLAGVIRAGDCRRMRFMEHEALDKLKDARRRGYESFVPAWTENLKLVREELSKRGRRIRGEAQGEAQRINTGE
jgi:hypothetical protein